MFNQDSVRRYIIEKLGGIRAETNWQKYNKNKTPNDANIEPISNGNSVQSKHKHNKPQNSDKDN